MELRHAEALAVKLMAQHGLCADPSWDFSKRVGWAGSNKTWTFKWDNAYRRFGVCNYWNRTIGMSKKLVAINGEAEVTDTILHEIAHALAPRGANHGEEWKAVCRRIGARPVACYSSTAVATVQAKFEGRCPTCHKVFTKFRRPDPRRIYSCPCRPSHIKFADHNYLVLFRKVGDVVVQPRGNARTMGGLVVPTGRPPMVPIQPPIKFNPVVPDAVAWYAGRLLPIELVTAFKEENVATLNPEQIAYIQRIQQERGISYKSAVQYWRRNLKPAQVAAVPTPAPVVAVPAYEPAPVDQTETILCDVPAPVSPVAVLLGETRGNRDAPSGCWNEAVAIRMYQQGGKQIDIAQAMGYPRGQGQTRVRRALVAAGVWHGAN
jgi:predicted SprT family Zn-dependent metalloprotease